MPQTYSDQEDRILQAISAWQDHPAQPISQIARDFDVPYWSLYRRLHSVPSYYLTYPAIRGLWNSSKA
ncbi:hypothetical protein GJ744_012140 [Endocarpon pusillum]|uniref:HTH psq-type domain-containing protein n=1 Tax=Endocarpon pusillum TaxID=364733 RepID=A0A8H7E300_9EURO|nr:hypothetical protein GJ744_012140 [Endocarpon pusillum]